MMHLNAGRLMMTAWAGVAAAVTVATPVARGDDYIRAANDFYATIQPAKRSDLVILPLVAKMDPPPASAATPEAAALLPAGTSGWSAAEQWAMAAPQRAVLDGLKRVSGDENIDTGFAFGQPYGAEAVGATSEGIALVRAGLYTDLGAPPLLAAAQFKYLPALERVACLVNVEATRLLADNKPAEAIGVLVDYFFFARQIADRAFFKEARWGLRNMIGSLERIRDVAYQDFRGARGIQIEQIQSILNRLRPDGFVSVDRIRFPRAERIAAEQVIASTFQERGGPNRATFAQTMARLGSTDRPLRLFSEAARWDSVAALHGNWEETRQAADRVYNDMVSRWPLDAFDPRNTQTTDYARLNQQRFAAVAETIPDMNVLFNDRQVLRAHLVGTRCSLGVIGFVYRNKTLPPTLASIRPAFVREIEVDPFNSQRAARPVLEYFVPIRDTAQGSGEPRPHEINVIARGMNFQVRLRDDQFVLYSVGPDSAKGWARNVEFEPARGSVGDLLLWPPVVSLARQHMLERGTIR